MQCYKERKEKVRDLPKRSALGGDASNEIKEHTRNTATVKYSGVSGREEKKENQPLREYELII